MKAKTKKAGASEKDSAGVAEDLDDFYRESPPDARWRTLPLTLAKGTIEERRARVREATSRIKIGRPAAKELRGR